MGLVWWSKGSAFSICNKDQGKQIQSAGEAEETIEDLNEFAGPCREIPLISLYFTSSF